ncbi:MAG: hypothetical protein OSA23_05550 [Rhodospirillales bacterium]|nr:hypothetical protein [Rhodospirillales bacterium]
MIPNRPRVRRSEVRGWQALFLLQHVPSGKGPSVHAPPAAAERLHSHRPSLL